MLQDPLNVYSTLPGLSLDGLGPRYVHFKNTSGDYGAGLMFSAFLELYPKKMILGKCLNCIVLIVYSTLPSIISSNFHNNRKIGKTGTGVPILKQEPKIQEQ